ncbi:MAG: hypothetical protein ACKO1F_02980 [Flammeovirgaceae bacterium]
MGRHEIRMRRQRTTAHGSERYRNYNAVLKQHETDMKIKKIMKVFVYFLIIAFVTILLVMVMRWEKQQSEKSNQKSTSCITEATNWSALT